MCKNQRIEIPHWNAGGRIQNQSQISQNRGVGNSRRIKVRNNYKWAVLADSGAVRLDP